MSDKFKKYIIALEMADGKVHRIPFALPMAEKGDKGDKGETPIIGIDYWTEEDKKEIRDYVDKEIAEFDFVKVLDVRPEVGLPNREYFIRKANGDTNDLFDEWAWINKGTEEEPDWDWEFKGTKKFEVEMADYVKHTDYATKDKAGVVKLLSSGDAYSGIVITAKGELVLAGATSAPSDAIFDNPQYYSVPVLAKNLYRWIKVGLSKNTETWTDEDKAKACETIGAVKKPATPTNMSVITMNTSGVVGVGRISTTPANYAIPQSNSKGNIKTNTPEDDLDCVNKKYAEDNFARKLYLHTIKWGNSSYTFISNSGTQLSTFDDFYNYYNANRATIMNERFGGMIVTYVITGGPLSLGGDTTFTMHSSNGSITSTSLAKSAYQGDTVTAL